MPTITAAMCARGRTLAEPRLSPDGSRLAFLSTGSGWAHIAVVAADGGAEEAVTSEAVVRAHPRGGGTFAWTPDGREIVFATRSGGLRAVLTSGGASRTVVEGDDLSGPSVSPDGVWVAYVRDQRDVAVAATAGGRRAPWPMRVSSGENDFALDVEWSPDGRWLTWLEWDAPAMAWNASRIMVAPLDGRDDPRAVVGGDGVGVQQPRFSPDGRHLGFLSDATGWLNVWVANADGSEPRPLVDEAFEHGDATWGPGQRSWAWSPDGRSVAFTRNEGGFGRLCIASLEGGEIREVAKAWHYGLSWQGDALAAVRTGARTPPRAVVYDPGGGSAGRRVVAQGGVGFGEATLIEPEVVHWSGHDGADVHGRLYRPERPAGEPPPMLVWIHGGPTGQQVAAFDARVAYFVDRGWAVLVPDHRGSTGWGRGYASELNGRWGDLDSADTAAGMRAAAERGWADPRRIVPIGASAGGFTVLCLLAWHGELCAAGVDLYGPADLLDLGERTHRFERHYLDSIVGPLPECADRYHARSPIRLADRIRGPVLVLHGSDDAVVPASQSKELVEAIRRAGGTVEHHVYEGEGHGWSRPETVEDELERIEDFLRRHVLRWRG